MSDRLIDLAKAAQEKAGPIDWDELVKTFAASTLKLCELQEAAIDALEAMGDE